MFITKRRHRREQQEQRERLVATAERRRERILELDAEAHRLRWQLAEAQGALAIHEIRRRRDAEGRR